MTAATLTIDLDAVAANWRALARLNSAETGATIKADAYGLGVAPVARRLAAEGVRSFFVALADEGAALRRAIGPGPRICVFSGHMAGDAGLLRDHGLVPMLNAPAQVARHREALPGHPFGVQLDTGMNRLGMEAPEWTEVRDWVQASGPELVMSHLASADEPGSDQNPRQLAAFRSMTDGLAAPRSLAATGGLLLGPAYHFDLGRPGIGLYGGAPFEQAQPVVTLSLPVIQTRLVETGEPVGYNATWIATRPSLIATVAAGYADGILRSLSNKATLWAGLTPCPVVGRVSMDLITVDVTDLPEIPEAMDLLAPHHGVDAVAATAGTIGYEILTSLGPRYRRRYLGAIG